MLREHKMKFLYLVNQAKYLNKVLIIYNKIKEANLLKYSQKSQIQNMVTKIYILGKIFFGLYLVYTLLDSPYTLH